MSVKNYTINDWINDKKFIEKLTNLITVSAMAIVNYTNEVNNVSVEQRQKTNDECFDFAYIKLCELMDVYNLIKGNKNGITKN